MDLQRSYARAMGRKIDKQTARETAGRGRIDPRWAQGKAKIPTVDTIRKEPEPQTGTYGPRGKKHPEVGKRYLRKMPPIQMTEGDVPLCNPNIRRAENLAKVQFLKSGNKLFPGHGRNPLAGQPLNLGEPGKGKALPTQKHPTPMPSKRMDLGAGQPLRPPLFGMNTGWR